MKLTSKGRYAVMAMADLAKSNSNQPISLSEISLRQGISVSFLEQIFLKLKKNNLVQSSRGPSGGYILEKSPKDIKISNILWPCVWKCAQINKYCCPRASFKAFDNRSCCKNVHELPKYFFFTS